MDRSTISNLIIVGRGVSKRNSSKMAKRHKVDAGPKAAQSFTKLTSPNRAWDSKSTWVILLHYRIGGYNHTTLVWYLDCLTFQVPLLGHEFCHKLSITRHLHEGFYQWDINRERESLIWIKTSEVWCCHSFPPAFGEREDHFSLGEPLTLKMKQTFLGVYFS